MKISENTLGVLKNFSAINPGIAIKPGSMLQTVSPQKTVMAEATITESFEKSFAIYDLNSMLSVFSLAKDIPEIEFGDKFLKIVGYDKRSTTNYFYTEPTMIIAPPDKKINFPSSEIEFKLTAEDLAYTLRYASVLQSPHIVFESDGKNIYVSTSDVKVATSHNQKLNLGASDGAKYRMIYKKEHLDFLMPKTYNVTISSKFISKFVSDDKTLTYWVAVEKEGSKYES